jgi:multicomponent Na+:H+ antiporter subunit G
MEYLSEIFSWIFILLGSLLILIGSIGLIRLPDFWSRLHGASITDTGGVLFLLIGMMIQAGSIWIFLKLVAIGIFLFVSSPTASHAIANAAYVTFGYNSKREAKK